MRSQQWKSLAAALFAVASVVALPTSVAAADTEGVSLVVLGDSFTATAPVLGQADDGCVRSPSSWPNQLAGTAGILGTADFLDVSCNGGTLDTGGGWTLVHQARKAAAQAAFGPATRAVLIQAGMNDVWGRSSGTAFPSTDCLLNLAQGCGLDAADQNRLPDYRAVTGAAYANRIREVVEFVRYYATNSKIVLVGYPEIFASGQQTACMDLVGIGRVVQPHAEGYLAYLDRLQDAQRDAAGQLRIDFFDARAVTAGHSSCSAEPWISGLAGADSPFAGAPVHPNAKGNATVAAGLAPQIGR
ncbi:SGNH/GDSL hydrolase family protein [Nocardia sp. NPDC051052]|uniref:SGNH/GDSL hydrolase family protein n=1 Tax=Nocardia sp. NPDC051052 TaxID=3364322 RepID=UPI00379FC071